MKTPITALLLLAGLAGLASAGGRGERDWFDGRHSYRPKNAPTISCGAGAAIEGNDESGIVTFSAATTTCTVTFNQTWSSALINAKSSLTTQPPICTATLSTATAVGIASVSFTAITFVFTSRSAGEKLYYHCDGWMQ